LESVIHDYVINHLKDTLDFLELHSFPVLPPSCPNIFQIIHRVELIYLRE